MYLQSPLVVPITGWWIDPRSRALGLKVLDLDLGSGVWGSSLALGL